MELKMPKRFYDDRDWAYSNYNSLIKKYGDRWVAVYRKKIVASSENISETIILARKSTGIENIPVIFLEKMAYVYKG